MGARARWMVAGAIVAACDSQPQPREVIVKPPDREAEGPGCRPGINPGAPVWNGARTLTTERVAAIADTGIATVRLDFRRDGGWDEAALARYGEIIDDLQAHGVGVHGLVTYEAIAAGQEQWNDDADGDGMNDAVVEFADTFAMLVDRFGDRITRWELWNEPNCYGESIDDPQHAGCYYVLPRVLAHMTVEAYLRVRDRVDAGTHELVLGGLLAQDVWGPLNTGAEYLDAVQSDGVFDWLAAETGRARPWSVVGVHPYVDQDRASDGAQIDAVVDAIEGVLDGHGDGSRIAISEVGWSIGSVDEATQAANLATAFATLSARARIDEITWFSWTDAPSEGLYFGMVDENGTPRAAHDTMRARVDACNQ